MVALVVVVFSADEEAELPLKPKRLELVDHSYEHLEVAEPVNAPYTDCPSNDPI